MRGSGVDAVASDNKVDGGESKGRFSRVVKWSCQRAITDALSDNSVPSADINGAHTVERFCLSWRNLANASLMSPHSR